MNCCAVCKRTLCSIIIFDNRLDGFGLSSLATLSISGSSDLRKWLILVRQLVHYEMLTLLQAVRISRLVNSRHVCHSWAAGDHLQQGLLHSQGGRQTNYQEVCAQQTMKKPYHMQTEAADAFLPKIHQRSFRETLMRMLLLLEVFDKRQNEEEEAGGKKRKTWFYKYAEEKNMACWNTFSIRDETWKNCFHQRTQMSSGVWIWFARARPHLLSCCCLNCCPCKGCHIFLAGCHFFLYHPTSFGLTHYNFFLLFRLKDPEQL